MSSRRAVSDLRLACDSLVALGNATADGSVLFAKNSDRPADECQPLVQIARQRHSPGGRLRCQYIDIAQVEESAAVIGSQPFWLWGFEHGLNEHGVAIGNHTVFTKDALSGLGLIGMDLVRLGLERARSAPQAVDVITTLVAQYGQGGSGYNDKDWPYHNSFLIADRRAAFLLETSDRHWALREIRDVGSASNHLSIGTDWDALSAGVMAHASEQGWWSARDARFDFAGALRDISMAPEVISSGRYRRTCEILAATRGRISPASLRAALRDHYGSPIHRPGCAIDDERAFSVCMHADPVGTTTASMVARLPPDDEIDLLRCWTSLGSPCVGIFLPCYPIARLPARLSRGGAGPDPESPWWGFKQVLTLVERDFDRYGSRVRTHWDALEERLLGEAEAVEREALARLRRNDHDAAATLLSDLMERNLARVCDELNRLITALADS